MRRKGPTTTPPSPPATPRTPAPAVSERRPLAVAITGGIGAGKSAALAALARHGAATLSADDVVHRLLREDAVRGELVERWGERVLGRDGAIDRSRVAEIVFADAEELAWLEGVLHPRVVAETEAWREALAGADDPPALLAVEVPLLFETGGDRRFDAVLVVTAPPDVRAARTLVAAADRERRLVPDDEKVRRADFAYVNTGTLDDLDAWVAGVVRELERAP